MNGFFNVVSTSPFDYDAAKEYVRGIQWGSFWISMGYVVVIFTIKKVMENRKPFNIKLPLNLWNLWLAVFSIAGSLVTTKALFSEIYNKSLTDSYCKNGDFFVGTPGLWTFLFVCSKIAELGDTIFIVLRKRPLMFLHWYHHVATLNYGFLSYVDGTAFNTWIVWLNFTVHAIMYSYYCLASVGVKIPAVIARSITFLQITQFAITHVILFHVGYLVLAGTSCDTTALSYWYCLLMEISYLVLFGNFFYHSYIKGGGKKFNKEKTVTKEVGQKVE